MTCAWGPCLEHACNVIYFSFLLQVIYLLGRMHTSFTTDVPMASSILMNHRKVVFLKLFKASHDLPLCLKFAIATNSQGSRYAVRYICFLSIMGFLCTYKNTILIKPHLIIAIKNVDLV